MTYHLVRYYRTKRQLSKLELAQMAKLTPRVINNIESNMNHNPSRDTMIRISNALGIPPSVIFFPKEELEKRQMLSNMIIFIMDTMNITELEIMKRVSDMSNFINTSTPKSSPDPDHHNNQKHDS